MSIKELNVIYLRYLTKYPLLTKSLTAGLLNGLNETIASLVSKDYKSFKLTLNSKIVTMVIYGSLILTPVSHNLYGILNKIYLGKNLSTVMKICQILTSLTTITPTISAIFTSWLSIINNYELPKRMEINSEHDLFRTIKTETSKIKSIVQTGLYNDYFKILKSSLVTSCISLAVAQNFVAPELWVVFFNLIYFVLGTIQNTKLKKQHQKKIQDRKIE